MFRRLFYSPLKPNHWRTKQLTQRVLALIMDHISWFSLASPHPLPLSLPDFSVSEDEGGVSGGGSDGDEVILRFRRGDNSDLV